MSDRQTGTLTLSLEDREHALFDQFQVRVLSGNAQGKVVRSTRPRMEIGTHESVDLVLDDPSVSRFHCEITMVGERAVLRDLGSTNGTFVDQVSVSKAFLHEGARLSVGRTQLQFERASEKGKAPLSRNDRFGLLVGQSAVMRNLFAKLEKAAACDTTVLLTGETGTGKDAAAESIHQRSSRSQGAFVIVDCGAIAATLLESELFGHEKGAFTGADERRIGAFEAARDGTLFLDEVGELGLELQPKLLRAIERREIKRLGSNKYQPVDVRLIAATNRNLRSEVNARNFRSDLYYRLAVLEIEMPPLRDRREDLPILVEHLLAARAVSSDSFVGSEEFMANLVRHNWPGNVRELGNYLERSLASSESEPLLAAQSAEPQASTTPADWRAARKSFERSYFSALLERTGGNVTAAARAAGLDRVYLHRLLKRHRLPERG